MKGVLKKLAKTGFTWIFRIERSIHRILSIGASEHYRSKVGAPILRLHHPANILNPHRMRCRGTFVAGEGLRIDLLENYRGQSFEPMLEVGDNFHAEKNLHIGVVSHMRIGKDVLVGSNVLIVDHNHGSIRDGDQSLLLPPADRALTRGRPISIGDRVWIGDGAIILPGTTLGEGSIVAANAVVSGDFPPGTLVSGPRSVAVRTIVSPRESPAI